MKCHAIFERLYSTRLGSTRHRPSCCGASCDNLVVIKFSLAFPAAFQLFVIFCRFADSDGINQWPACHEGCSFDFVAANDGLSNNNNNNNCGMSKGNGNNNNCDIRQQATGDRQHVVKLFGNKIVNIYHVPCCFCFCFVFSSVVVAVSIPSSSLCIVAFSAVVAFAVSPVRRPKMGFSFCITKVLSYQTICQRLGPARHATARPGPKSSTGAWGMLFESGILLARKDLLTHALMFLLLLLLLMLLSCKSARWDHL